MAPAKGLEKPIWSWKRPLGMAPAKGLKKPRWSWKRPSLAMPWCEMMNIYIYTYTYNGYNYHIVMQTIKYRHISVLFCCHTKAWLAKEQVSPMHALHLG